MKISRIIEWDMGHRITNHKSKCRNLHGHRYKAEICLEGNLITKSGDSYEGMVLDFGDMKTIANEKIDKELDHSFMIWESDEVLVKFFQENEDLKHTIVPFTPTAENIAAWLYEILSESFRESYGDRLRLDYIKLWETPNSIVLHNGETK